jgi:hypothetical protein
MQNDIDEATKAFVTFGTFLKAFYHAMVKAGFSHKDAIYLAGEYQKCLLTQIQK